MNYEEASAEALRKQIDEATTKQENKSVDIGVLNKVMKLAFEIIEKSEKLELLDEEIEKLSIDDKIEYLKNHSYLNGQMDIVNKVMEILSEEE